MSIKTDACQIDDILFSEGEPNQVTLFIYSCPNIRYQVQGFVADDTSDDAKA
jgi:hypothetical protein